MAIKTPNVVDSETFNALVQGIKPLTQDIVFFGLRDRVARLLGFEEEDQLIAFQNRENRAKLTDLVDEPEQLPKRLILCIRSSTDEELPKTYLVTGTFPDDSQDESEMSSVMTSECLTGQAPRMVPKSMGRIAGKHFQDVEVDGASDATFFGLEADAFSNILPTHYGVTRSFIIMPDTTEHGRSELAVPELFEYALVEETGLLPHPDMERGEIHSEDMGDNAPQSLYLELTRLDD